MLGDISSQGFCKNISISGSNPQPNEGANGGTLLAFDALTMKQAYSNHTCTNRDRLSPTVKFSVPTVANGNVYMGAYAVDGNGNSIPNGMFYILGLNAGSCQ